jgi:transcriptional regulator with PAS, ATPase and Fis domain
MVSQDPGMHRAFEIVRNVAATEATVLVRGESGTGKELVARALHLESRRKDGPFLAVNCAAISPSLLESELFGHIRGAFTGAVKDRAGLFQQANGGTLFLDEVAELPLDLQAKLLRVLQERVVVPVGGNDPVPVDIRVVAATHTSLRDAVARGRFREDLLYRLRVVPIFLPPLRDRLGDIEILLWQFIERQNQIGPRRIDRLQPEVLTRLRAHRWPGNVRELGNVVEYAFAVGRGPAFSEADLPPDLVETARGAPPAAHLTEDDERSRLLAALESAGGHVGRAAELLGMSRPTFWRHRKRLGV